MRPQKPTAFLWIVGVLVGLLLAAPALILLPMSFTEGRNLVFPPQGFSLQWYEGFFSSKQWMSAAQHSLTIGLCTMALSIVLGLPIAMMLARSRSRLLGVTNALVLGPAVVPPIITAIGTFGFMAAIGITRSLPGLVAAHTVLALPLVVISILASAQTLDRNVELAAQSLGAGPLQVFRHAVLPPLVPGVMVAAVYGFATSWDEMIVSLFITGPQYSTLPVHMWNQVRNVSDPTVVAVSTMLVSLSTFILVIAFVVIRVRQRDGRTRKAVADG